MRKILVILVMLTGSALKAEITTFDWIFDKYEVEYQLPKNLLKSICTVESDLREKVVVFNDGGKGDNGYGMCQIQYHTAIMLGMKPDPKCLGRVSSHCKLLNAETNIRFAAIYLRNQHTRYENNLMKTISSYNAGSAIKGNHKYVRKVLKVMKGLEE